MKGGRRFREERECDRGMKCLVEKEGGVGLNKG